MHIGNDVTAISCRQCLKINIVNARRHTSLMKNNWWLNNVLKNETNTGNINLGLCFSRNFWNILTNAPVVNIQ